MITLSQIAENLNHYGLETIQTVQKITVLDTPFTITRHGVKNGNQLYFRYPKSQYDLQKISILIHGEMKQPEMTGNIAQKIGVFVNSWRNRNGSKFLTERNKVYRKRIEVMPENQAIAEIHSRTWCKKLSHDFYKSIINAKEYRELLSV